MLGHSGTGAARPWRWPAGAGGEAAAGALEARDVAVFVADLATSRDRAMALRMLLGGLRAMEVRGLLLADVDVGLRRVRVVGKGGKERTVPVDAAFFTELATYLRSERPPGCATRECFVGAARPDPWPGDDRGRDAPNLSHPPRAGRDTAGSPAPAATYLRNPVGFGGNGFAGVAIIDAAVSPETTAGYVHLSTEMLAAEYTAARAAPGPGCDHPGGDRGRRHRDAHQFSPATRCLSTPCRAVLRPGASAVARPGNSWDGSGTWTGGCTAQPWSG